MEQLFFFYDISGLVNNEILYCCTDDPLSVLQDLSEEVFTCSMNTY